MIRQKNSLVRDQAMNKNCSNKYFNITFKNRKDSGQANARYLVKERLTGNWRKN